MDPNNQIPKALELPPTRKSTGHNPRTLPGLYTLVPSRSPRHHSQPLLSLSPSPQICTVFPRQWEYDNSDESGVRGGEQREKRRGSCQKHMECLVFTPAHIALWINVGVVFLGICGVPKPSEHRKGRTAPRGSQLNLHCLKCSAKSSDYWVRKWYDCICHLGKNLIKKCTLKQQQHCFLRAFKCVQCAWPKNKTRIPIFNR